MNDRADGELPDDRAARLRIRRSGSPMIEAVAHETFIVHHARAELETTSEVIGVSLHRRCARRRCLDVAVTSHCHLSRTIRYVR